MRKKLRVVAKGKGNKVDETDEIRITANGVGGRAIECLNALKESWSGWVARRDSLAG